MARKAFMDAVSCLAHILHFASFTGNAINEVIALTGNILFTLIFSLCLSASNSA